MVTAEQPGIKQTTKIGQPGKKETKPPPPPTPKHKINTTTFYSGKLFASLW